MQLGEVKVLYNYTYWATERLIEVAANLSAAQLNDEMLNGIGSIRVTLVHLLNGHWIWRERWQSNQPTIVLQPQDFPSLETIKVHWQEEKLLMSALLATLSEEDLERQIIYHSTMLPGQVFRLPLWQMLLHLVNHGTQHRGEIAMRLTELGHSPGELGMNFFFVTHP